MKQRFDRYTAKMTAKSLLRQSRPGAMWVTLVYLMLTAVLPNALFRLLGDPVGEVLSCLQMGYTPAEVFNYVLLSDPGHTAILAVLGLVFLLFTAGVEYGYTSYCLRLSRRQGADFIHLLDGFSRFGRVLWLSVLRNFFTLLWMIPCLLPAILVLVLSEASWSAYQLFMALYFAGFVGAMIICLRYALATYFLLDDPDCTAWQAIRRSVAAMKGRKEELLLLHLSFLGWYLLEAVVSGTLSLMGLAVVGLSVTYAIDLWLRPYMDVTVAGYYNFLTAGDRPDSGYTGPVYGHGPENGPEPF